MFDGPSGSSTAPHEHDLAFLVVGGVLASMRVGAVAHVALVMLGSAERLGHSDDSCSARIFSIWMP